MASQVEISETQKAEKEVLVYLIALNVSKFEVFKYYIVNQSSDYKL